MLIERKPIIRQRTKHDCAICTISMATNREYDEVYAAGIKVQGFHPERGTSSEEDILEELGFKGQYKATLDKCSYVVKYNNILDPEYFRETVWGRPSILTVPSLNKEGGLHSVYYDGHHLYDPSLANTYTTFKELRPRSVIIFRAGMGGSASR